MLEQEAAEDVYRISAVGNIKHTYFETPFNFVISTKLNTYLASLSADIFFGDH